MIDLFKAMDNWQKIRTTRRELGRLTDRELADIGITRADIRWVSAQNK